MTTLLYRAQLAVASRTIVARQYGAKRLGGASAGGAGKDGLARWHGLIGAAKPRTVQAFDSYS